MRTGWVSVAAMALALTGCANGKATESRKVMPGSTPSVSAPVTIDEAAWRAELAAIGVVWKDKWWPDYRDVATSACEHPDKLASFVTGMAADDAAQVNVWKLNVKYACPQYLSRLDGVTTPTAPDVLKAKHFKLAYKELDRQCFGSAGCNVTYRVTPTYVGPGSVDEIADRTIDITYRVIGAESSEMHTITLDGGKYSNETQMTSTTADTPLKIQIASVESY